MTASMSAEWYRPEAAALIRAGIVEGPEKPILAGSVEWLEN